MDHAETQQRSNSQSAVPPAPIRDNSSEAHGSQMDTQSATQRMSFGTMFSRAGPLSAPSSPSWRRNRILAISAEGSGSPQTTPVDDNSPLLDHMVTSYGSLPGNKGSTAGKRRSRTIRRPPSLPHAGGNQDISSQPPSPTTPLYRTHSLQGSFLNSFRRRPLSAYDAIHGSLDVQLNDHEDNGGKANGIRVWYSSFTSIDWLHDAIKDSARMHHLRKRSSIRGRLRNMFDRSLGWIMVTIVGFLTAVIAFLIIRSEQWLFDLKEGYCTDGVFKAKRFCCPSTADAYATAFGSSFQPTGADFMVYKSDSTCPGWKTWSDVFGPESGPGNNEDTEDWFVEYASYTFIALLLATSSSLLTIYLTASTSFVTRKESGFAPEFTSESKDRKQETPVEGARNRKVLYYVMSRIAGKYENNEGKRREILSASAAAGVAVAFGAPIGGVLFSLEEVSYFFPPKVMWRSFFCAMIAAVTLKFLDPFGTGKLVLFQVTYDKDWHAFELVPFLLLGIFGGIYGAYFSKLNYRWSKHVRNGTWLKSHPVVEVIIVTLVTSALGFLNVYTRMGGTELVYNLFAECLPGDDHSGLCVSRSTDPGPVVRAIALALVVKGALTVVTFGIKLPAGIFIPSLGVGACAGRILGIGIQYLQWQYPDWTLLGSCNSEKGDCVIPGIYAMVGAAATLSGVTRTTVSLAVIMFELTDSLTYVVPIMLSVLVAKTVADALEPKGIYDLVIELSQLPYLDAKQEYLWGGLHLSDVADRKVQVIHADEENTVRKLSDQLRRLASEGIVDGFPIITSERKLLGYLGANELEHALSLVADDPDAHCVFDVVKPYADLADGSVSSLPDPFDDQDLFDFSIYMDRAPLTVPEHAPLELVQQMFVKLGARHVIVLDTDGFYVGIIDKKSWIAFLGELEEKSG
ncbi:hypothetical protein FRC03_010476 [Tulasnella sp. 419]|nr:hypothetical protein FRC03_010476 [Tulasnella sp. 419]